MKKLLWLLLLSGCASVGDPNEHYATDHPSCVAVTLRRGDVCEVKVFYRPREGPSY
jgi:hypothetical protein